MFDMLFTSPSSAYSFNSAKSRAHELDLLNAAMDMFSAGREYHPTPSFPKHNVYRMLDGNPYTTYAEFALAGYSKESLKVEMEGGYLTISSKSGGDKKEDREYVHRGMARRDFSSRYYVGKDVEVRSAKFADGLLTVEMEKLVPEEKKPRSVTID